MKALIVGAGDSLDMEVVKNFDGMIICSDIVTHLVDDIRKIDYAVTLEDSVWYVDGHFAGKYNHEFPIVTSNRTQQPTKERLEKRFKLIPFLTPFSHVTWNVGMMGWIFAWKELNIKDITLTGFDSLESPRHPEHKIWKETLQEINKILLQVMLLLNTWVKKLNVYQREQFHQTLTNTSCIVQKEMEN
jgi:hypothetical protein